MSKINAFALLGAALILPATPTFAQEVPASAPPAVEAVAEDVRWSGSVDHDQAADRLILLLKTSDFEGYSEGPTIAAQAASLQAQAKVGDKAAAAQLANLLDRAYLDYVAVLQSVPADVEIGDPAQRNEYFSRADHMTLLDHSPSLFRLVRTQTGKNVVYEQLRASVIAHGRTLPPETQAALKGTLQRLRALPKRDKFVLVDVATAKLWMFENGQPVDSMKVVVGREPLEKRTPLINSTIHYVTHQPYWHVPYDLVRTTVGPNIRRQGNAYLKRQGYEIVDRWAVDAQVLSPADIDWSTALQPGNLKVRQLPGPRNSMGDFKFNFPNATGIYLHDTPTKQYFAEDVRALSNGCIRLEDAARFANWLYKGQGVPEIDVTETHDPIPYGVPVFVTYLTAEAVEGPMTLAYDIYGLDGAPDLTTQVAQATALAEETEAEAF